MAVDSDVDLLAIVEGFDSRFDLDTYSVYSYGRLRELWEEGNPFAWHLHLESRLLFSGDGSDFLVVLGEPREYQDVYADCEKFRNLLGDAWASLASDGLSSTFDLSTAFLAIRNFATCYSLGTRHRPDFSRHSALKLGTDSLRMDEEAYRVLERSRILCTRGSGPSVDHEEVLLCLRELPAVSQWMRELMGRITCD